VQLPEGTRAVEQYYQRAQVWPNESLARRRFALLLQESASQD
jgi:hypothetical protein